jgi:16S rRNA (cytosine967-C5)-methyltransferase
VALARTVGLAPFAGLVNAVLRKVASGGAALLEALDSPRLDTPAWLWASWGMEARGIAEAHQREAPLDVTLAPGESVPAGGQGLPTGSVRYPAGTHVSEIPGFTEGRMWVQDAAAALPVRLLAPQPGEQVADLCAAPGGKTAQLASAGAIVTAVERDPVRLARLVENFSTWKLQASFVRADVLTWTPPALFDAVLLDAPCSATGTIRRHPDVPHLKRPRDIKILTDAQDKLLAAAARMVKPGGRLIYAVCSLQPEEGADRLALVPGMRVEAFRPDELSGLPEGISRDGFLRTHPGMWADRGGMDGFFAGKLVRD